MNQLWYSTIPSLSGRGTRLCWAPKLPRDYKSMPSRCAQCPKFVFESPKGPTPPDRDPRFWPLWRGTERAGDPRRFSGIRLRAELIKPRGMLRLHCWALIGTLFWAAWSVSLPGELGEAASIGPSHNIFIIYWQVYGIVTPEYKMPRSH